MASHPSNECCITGVKHDGTPRGGQVRIADRWDGYYAGPEKSNERKNVALLYLPDVLGIWQNSKIMADQFAANGYPTLVVDIFNRDALPVNRPPDLDMGKWVREGSDGQNPHTPNAVDPIVEAAIQFLKEHHIADKIGAVGYCFGAKYVIRHYKSGINVGFIAHPSNTEEQELASIQGPLHIAAAENDALFSTEKRHASERILAECGVPYQMTLYSGVKHGFAVRGDPADRRQVFAKDQAFQQAVAWFNEYLL